MAFDTFKTLKKSYFLPNFTLLPPSNCYNCHYYRIGLLLWREFTSPHIVRNQKKKLQPSFEREKKIPKVQIVVEFHRYQDRGLDYHYLEQQSVCVHNFGHLVKSFLPFKYFELKSS